MKRTPRWIAVLLAAFLVAVAVPSPVVAGISVRLNVAAMSFQVPPRMEGERVLVPMRAIFEALGAEVSWDQELQEVTAQTTEQTVKLKVGQRTAQVNGQLLVLDVPPVVVEDRTLVPVRFVAESLGALVEWDNATQTVKITPGAGVKPGTGFRSAPGTPEELLARALPATVMILVKNSSGVGVGSGFFLNDRGLIATDYPVLEGATAVQVVTHDEKQYALGAIVAANPAADMVIAETTATGYPARPWP